MKGVLGQVLPRAARAHGAKTALVFGERSFSYVELDQLSDRVARSLADRGIAPGDVVSLYSFNRWEWIVAYHGVLKAGGVANPINVMLTPEEVAFVLNDCGGRAIMTAADNVPAVLSLRSEVPTLEHVVSFDDTEGATPFETLLSSHGRPPPGVPVAPEALSTIAYTSGTTGHPKGAMQSHLAVFLNCALTASVHVKTPTDIVVTALPAPHVYGNVVVNGTFMAGGTVILMDRFDPASALGLIEANRATAFEGVPTMYALMLAHPDVDSTDLSSLTRCTVGGQTISIATMEEWERRSGAPPIELWGMTEIAGLARPIRSTRPTSTVPSASLCRASTSGSRRSTTQPSRCRPARPESSWFEGRS